MTKSNKPIFIDFLTTKVEQRTKDGKVDILTVVKMLNEQRLKNGLTKKEVTHLFENDDFQVFIMAMIIDLDLFDQLCAFHETQNSSVHKVTQKTLRKLGLYQYSSVKNKSGEKMWYHPILASKIIAWLNPEYDYLIHKLIAKEFFKDRIAISDLNNELMASVIQNIGMPELSFYPEINILLNKKVYGRHEKDIRNTSTEKNIDEFKELINELKVLLKIGYIKNHTSMISYLKD